MVNKFAIATVSTSNFIPAQDYTENVSRIPTKQDRRFTFVISTLWGSFIFVCSQHRVCIMFDEKDS
jgi:hypothetical protein